MLAKPTETSDRQTSKGLRGRWKLYLALTLGLGTVLLGLLFLFVVFFVISSSGPKSANGNGPAPMPTQTAAPKLPEFPWPPRSSAYTRIPNGYLLKPQGQTLLKDVAAELESALRSGGYGQTGYYSIPGGFALVSRLEQFKTDGAPATDPYRWSQQVENPRVFSVDYVRDLIRGKIGRYRVIVFAVSSDFFSQQTGRRVDIEKAATIAIEGANALPPDVGDLPYADNYTCTALVYEFEKLALDKPATFKENSTLMAETHLQKILPYLQR